MNSDAMPWHEANLVAVDLEGSGPQDCDDEAILEIATVPLIAGRPALAEAYATLINPGRTIPPRPWISPGLTNQALRVAPTLAEVEPELAARFNGRVLVGHNIGVDWRLLHRHCPTIAAAGLIDTLRLARTLNLDSGRSLTKLLDHFDLTSQVHDAVPGGIPHRALWDTVAVALLLAALIDRGWDVPPSLTELVQVAALPTTGQPANPICPVEPDTLF